MRSAPWRPLYRTSPVRPGLTSDRYRAAFCNVGSIGGHAIVMSLLLPASLFLNPKRLSFVQDGFVEGSVLFLFKKLKRDWASPLFHGAPEHHFIPRLYLITRQDRKRDFIHRGWKASQGLALSREGQGQVWAEHPRAQNLGDGNKRISYSRLEHNIET